MHRNAKLAISVLVATSMVALAGCSATAKGEDTKTLKIVYEKTDSFTALDTLFTKCCIPCRLYCSTPWSPGEWAHRSPSRARSRVREPGHHA